MNVSLLLYQCEQRHIKLHVIAGDLKITAPKGALTQGLVQSIRNHKADILASLQTLESWKWQIAQAQTKEQIFEILDWFRQLPWTDEQRAEVSQTYIRRIDHLQAQEDG